MLEATIHGVIDDEPRLQGASIAFTVRARPGRTMRKEDTPARVSVLWMPGNPEDQIEHYVRGKSVVVTGPLEVLRRNPQPGEPDMEMVLHAEEVVGSEAGGRHQFMTVVVAGKLRDAPKYLPDARDGQEVVNFVLRVFNQRCRSEAMTLYCQLWGRQAGQFARTVSAKDRVNIVGALRPQVHTHRETNREHTRAEVLVDNWFYGFDKYRAQDRQRRDPVVTVR